MNPDAYMPYYGATFEAALKGYGPEVKWAYLAACWHYWHHTHCEGLPADDDYLRCVCDCPIDRWARVRGVIFSGPPFFHLNGNGRWHQKGCAEIYAEAMRAYQNRVTGAAKAREARAESKDDDNVDTNSDDSSDSRDAINPQSKSKSKSKEESESKPKTKRLNDERITSNGDHGTQPANSRSSPIRSKERALMDDLSELLGEDEMKRAGGHWRANWVRQRPELVERGLAELRLQLREHAEIDNRGAYLEDLLKRWA